MPHHTTKNFGTSDRVLRSKRNFKELPQKEEQIETIILLNANNMKKYRVFLDEDIGIPFKYQDHVLDTTQDEDYQSSEEVIENGVKHCMKFLSSSFKKTKKLKTEPLNSSQNSESIETIADLKFSLRSK